MARGIGKITVKALGGLELGRSPASAGAHRLLWWLLWCKLPMGRQARLEELGLRAGDIEDYLLGARLPGDDLAARIGFLTRGTVRFMDWHRPPTGGWVDMPIPRPHTMLAAA
jgi:hypothetical protein